MQHMEQYDKWYEKEYLEHLSLNYFFLEYILKGVSHIIQGMSRGKVYNAALAANLLPTRGGSSPHTHLISRQQLV